MNIENNTTNHCPSDLRIATLLSDSPESEFPPTMKCQVHAKNFTHPNTSVYIDIFCATIYNPFMAQEYHSIANIENNTTNHCPSDLRIATLLSDSPESEFSRTSQNAPLIQKFTIK